MSLTSWFRKMFSRSEQPQKAELGRNDLCWCGSGKKYKRCHLGKDSAEQREANYAAMVAKRRQGGGGIVPGGSKKAAQRPPENTTAAGRR
ncbi:MAG TPA: SEC-C domain-containing protein [Thermoanaerobaculia bacterium]|nr:SEC-C domain-containing protein [Thermoanaerobaculia bacterium]